MNITSIELAPDNSSNIITLSFKDPTNQTPYNIKGATGLDAEDILSQPFMGFNNSQLSDFILPSRTLVFVIELNPSFVDKENFGLLRDVLYRTIWTSRRGSMDINFKNGNNVVATISGIVTKFEAAPFSKTQAVQITVDCQDPLFKGSDDVNVDTDPLNHSRFTVYDKLSNAPHGFNFMIQFTEAAESFTIQNLGDNSWIFEIAPLDGFLVNDLLIGSTVFGSKYLYISRGINTIPLIDAITPGSVWPIMFPGTNNFLINDFHKIDWQLFTYVPTYWGI